MVVTTLMEMLIDPVTAKTMGRFNKNYKIPHVHSYKGLSIGIET